MSWGKALIKELFSKRWWWVTLLVIGLMILLARLGFWQLDRLEARRAENLELAAALDVPPTILDNSLLDEDPAAMKDRQVTVSGEYDIEQQVIWKLQKWQEQHGVHIITPLVLDDGQTAVLVDRGWIPDSERPNIADYDIPGEVQIDGYAALSQTLSDGDEGGQQGPQEEWYRVDIPAIQQQLPYELLPFYVQQTEVEDYKLPHRSGLDIDLSEGNHLSYAAQWFIFSLGLGIGYLAYVNKRMKEPAKE